MFLFLADVIRINKQHQESGEDGCIYLLNKPEPGKTLNRICNDAVTFHQHGPSFQKAETNIRTDKL